MSRSQHPLFERYPQDGMVVIDGQSVPTPYHIYDGSMAFIGGWADATVAQHLLEGQSLTPILDQAGRALMAVWLCDFTEASLGPHHELQISLFASFQPQVPVDAHPLAIYQLLALNPATMMVCHGLWNNTNLVVNYNREHLGLDAHLSESQINYTDGHMQARVRDATSQQQLIESSLAATATSQSRLMWQMTQQLGLAGLFQMMRSPFVQVPVVNTITEHLPQNRIARTYTRNDRQSIRYVDPTTDKLIIHHPLYRSLQFQPNFVQFGSGVRFVYLCPEKSTDGT